MTTLALKFFKQRFRIFIKGLCVGAHSAILTQACTVYYIILLLTAFV